MNVLAISATMDPVRGGGNAERTLQLCHALTQKDILVSLLTLDKGLTTTYKKTLMAYHPSIITCFNQRFDLFASGFKQIKTQIQNADVIHMIGHWSLLNAVSYYYIKKYDKPYFFCPAGAYIPRGRSKFIKKFYNFLVGNRLLKQAHKIIAVTHDEATQLKNFCHSEKILVIPNGINPSDYKTATTSLPKTLGIETPYFLFMGRLNEVKGPDLLLEAFKNISDSYPAYTLVLAGPDDGMLEYLKQQVAQYNLNHRVVFTGHIAGEIKTQLLTQASCLIIPSRSEAMSIVILEAGICKTPAIVTDQCGLTSFLETGSIIEVPVNSTKIYDGIKQFIVLPETKKIEMGEYLYQFVNMHYSWLSIINTYIKEFSGAVKKALSEPKY